jgi:Thoeris protein ThsA, Macro domain
MRRMRFMLMMWIRGLISARAVTAILSSFGTLWVFIEIAAFFLQSTAIPQWLRDHWWLFAIIGAVTAIIKCRPRTVVSQKLNGRDVTVEIAIGDVFSFDGALIVGSNTTFDTRISPTLIAENSVQGTFTRRYFADEAKLDIEIEAALNTGQAQHLRGKREGKLDRYPIGTVVRLNPKGRSAYFVAIADINEHGVAAGTFEGLRVSLAEMWVYVGSRGLKERLVMPVLGTGFSRLPQTREQVVREIVKSFVAACSEHVFADRLTIVLSPNDVADYKISLDELGAFLGHVCFYTEFPTHAHGALGAPA